MDTLQEALFRDMLSNDWFTQSDGDVESPTGYFGYMVNAREDWNSEFYSAFGDTIATYVGDTFSTPDYAENWIRANFCGVYSAYINSHGIISIYKHGDYVRTNTAVLGIEPTPIVREAMQTFANRVHEYQEWENN